MRGILIFTFLIAISVLLGTQGIKLFNQERELRKEFAEMSTQVKHLVKENEELKKRIEYLSYPENLEKELRALNYKAAGEKLMILINESR